jgi:hypothetical protein
MRAAFPRAAATFRGNPILMRVYHEQDFMGGVTASSYRF